ALDPTFNVNGIGLTVTCPNGTMTITGHLAALAGGGSARMSWVGLNGTTAHEAGGSASGSGEIPLVTTDTRGGTGTVVMPDAVHAVTGSLTWDPTACTVDGSLYETY